MSSHRQEGRVTIGNIIGTIRVWVWAQEGVSSEEKGRKRSVRSQAAGWVGIYSRWRGRRLTHGIGVGIYS